MKEEEIQKISFDNFREEVLEDYRLARISRQCSVVARKEVLTGKAKFGIFGDGKEVAQIVGRPEADSLNGVTQLKEQNASLQKEIKKIRLKIKCKKLDDKMFYCKKTIFINKVDGETLLRENKFKIKEYK